MSDTPYVIHVMVHDKRLIDTIFNELAGLVADVANDRADVFGTSIQCSMKAPGGILVNPDGVGHWLSCARCAELIMPIESGITTYDILEAFYLHVCASVDKHESSNI